jgi:hypothetical protein
VTGIVDVVHVTFTKPRFKHDTDRLVVTTGGRVWTLEVKKVDTLLVVNVPKAVSVGGP